MVAWLLRYRQLLMVARLCHRQLLRAGVWRHSRQLLMVARNSSQLPLRKERLSLQLGGSGYMV